MFRHLLTAKIHRATVTARDIHYPGSITIDPILTEAAGIVAWERVQVVDVDNGARLETYVIPGERGKGEIQLNGAAAHLVELGDKVIIMSYGFLNPEEVENHRPRVVIVGENNQIVEIKDE